MTKYILNAYNGFVKSAQTSKMNVFWEKMKLQKLEKKLVIQRVTGEPNFLKKVRKIDRNSVYSFLKIVDNYCKMSRISVE